MALEVRTRLLLPSLLLPSLLLLSIHALAGDPDGDLRARMGEPAFQAAGLAKLDAAELAMLEAWLDDQFEHQLTPLSTGAPSAAPEQEDGTAATTPKVPWSERWRQSDDRPEETRNRIAGTFSGWKGRTRFRLESGELWEQRLAGQYFFTAESPEVRIYRNRMGFYFMELIATGRTIGVKRVE